MIICPTCGGKKKDHPTSSWRIHLEMDKRYQAAKKAYMKSKKALPPKRAGHYRYNPHDVK